MSGRSAARARRTAKRARVKAQKKAAKSKAYRDAIGSTGKRPRTVTGTKNNASPDAGDRLAPMPEQVPLMQVDGKLQVGESTSMEPPPEWRPPFVPEDLWREVYHPEAGLSDREWLTVWAFFGRGRGSVTMTARALSYARSKGEGDGEDDGVKPATPTEVRKTLALPHVQAACEYVRGILAMSCLNEQDLRAWWSTVVMNDRVEIAHRLNASASLAKSMGMFIDRKEISHDIHVDLSQLSNDELARIAAGDRLGSHVVDATLTTTAEAGGVAGKGAAKALAPAKDTTPLPVPVQGSLLEQ